MGKKKLHFQETLHGILRWNHYIWKWQILVVVMLHSLFTINGLFITNDNEVIWFIWEGGKFCTRKTWIVVPSSAAGLDGELGQVILPCDASVSPSIKLSDGYWSFARRLEIWWNALSRSQVLSFLVLKGLKLLYTSGACI